MHEYESVDKKQEKEQKITMIQKTTIECSVRSQKIYRCNAGSTKEIFAKYKDWGLFCAQQWMHMEMEKNQGKRK